MSGQKRQQNFAAFFGSKQSVYLITRPAFIVSFKITCLT
jgi:hypothetical protein